MEEVNRLNPLDWSTGFNVASSFCIFGLGIAALRRFNTPLYATFILHGLVGIVESVSVSLSLNLSLPIQVGLLLNAFFHLIDVPVCLKFAGARPGLRKGLTLVQEALLLLLIVLPPWVADVSIPCVLGAYVYFIKRNRRRVYLPKEIMDCAVRGIQSVLLGAVIEIFITPLKCPGHLFTVYGAYLISLTPIYLQYGHDRPGIVLKQDFIGLPYLGFHRYLSRVESRESKK
jgi:hypothetical protein